MENTQQYFGAKERLSEQKRYLYAKNISFFYKKNIFSFKKDIKFFLEIDFFEGRAGDFYFVTGSPGSGKSTFLKLLCQDIVPQKGEITFFIENKNISRSFQETILFNNLTCFENLSLLYNEELCEKKKFIENIYWYLNYFDLLSCKEKKMREMSGGQKQLISFIRAMLIPSRIIILDEPTGQLDIFYTEKVMNILLNVRKNIPVMIFWATHDLGLVKKFHQKNLHFQNGKIVNKGFGAHGIRYN